MSPPSSPRPWSTTTASLCASTPTECRSALPAGRCHRPARSVLEVSHLLDGFLHTEDAGLLHPASDPGVRMVFVVPRPFDRSRRGQTGSVHHTQFTPSEELHSPAAALRHRSRCPLAVFAESRSTGSLTPKSRRSPLALPDTPFPAWPVTQRAATRSTSRRCSACPAEAGRTRHPKAPTRRVRCMRRRFRRSHALSIHGLCSLSRRLTTHEHRSARAARTGPIVVSRCCAPESRQSASLKGRGRISRHSLRDL